jgi:hypothetical protein
MYYSEPVARVSYNKDQALIRASNCLAILLKKEEENKNEFVNKYVENVEKYKKYWPKFIIDFFFISDPSSLRHHLDKGSKFISLTTRLEYRWTTPFLIREYIPTCQKIIKACQDKNTINLYLSIDDLHMFDVIETSLGNDNG